ncbi:MAG: tetratricopeptide repeat protein [Phycisphaerae bacterium]
MQDPEKEDPQPNSPITFLGGVMETFGISSPTELAIWAIVLCGVGVLLFVGLRHKAQSQSNMLQAGLSHLLGRGEPQDYRQAMVCFKKAADAGSGLAMNNIGIMYEAGDGVPQSYSKAMVWFQKAAKRDVADAMNNIGVLYANGDGVPQDYQIGMLWFQQGAAIGSAKAMLGIAMLYEKGDGVPQDKARAIRWYAKAIMSNDPQVGPLAKAAIARLQAENPGQ